MERKELLTAEEAAEYLNICKATILKWARKGKIERVKISAKVVLFSAESIDKFLREKTFAIESHSNNHKHAARAVCSKVSEEKGGNRRKSGESWRDLRQEVSLWD